MIELRWLNREFPFEVDAEHGSTYTDYAHERVLQYRIKHIPYSYVIGGPAPKWSDWIDVPEVEG